MDDTVSVYELNNTKHFLHSETRKWLWRTVPSRMWGRAGWRMFAQILEDHLSSSSGSKSKVKKEASKRAASKVNCVRRRSKEASKSACFVYVSTLNTEAAHSSVASLNFRLKHCYILEERVLHYFDSFLSWLVVAASLIQIISCVRATHPFSEDVWVRTIIETHDMLFLALSAIMSDVTLIHLAT